jgi:hypothetical protein
MSSLAPGARETHCLVYQVIKEGGIGVRSMPSIGRDCVTNTTFRPGALISVDLIKDEDVDATNSSGPFLRLSDDSGWLFEYKKGVRLMRPIPVHDGLWTFYVYNPGSGIALRWHPVDRQDVFIMVSSSSTEFIDFYTTQRIYCDKMVTHPDSGVN